MTLTARTLPEPAGRTWTTSRVSGWIWAMAGNVRSSVSREGWPVTTFSVFWAARLIVTMLAAEDVLATS
ncbi:hypothetical protein AA23498_2031 [Acetobacter nitrogenifigens DSM 23921 = NBRC 105050]|nr:hypothetical protein AA23498_2031 [Acetobacter nitrogenifigens DSM 23921 = NBRC 105050]